MHDAWPAHGSLPFATIYVTGLPRRMTEPQLAELCMAYGTISEARMERDPTSGALWPFGYVRFSSVEAARRAAQALHGMHYRGDVLAARQIETMPSAA